MIDFRPLAFDAVTLSQYASLFARCFPPSANFSAAYLHWLYCQNPDGLAIGFDAWDGERLAAHYVCVPARVRVRGQEALALLSLNTATHPEFQGKGLFTRLALLTYEAAASAGLCCVFGVANANSTAGFIRKLGFRLVKPLEARVGVGVLGIDWDAAHRNEQFSRVWSASSIDWRCCNPKNRVSLQQSGGITQCHAVAKRGWLSAYAELDVQQSMQLDQSGNLGMPFLRLFLGSLPEGACRFGGYVSIAQRFRPSPLNFIYRGLGVQSGQVDAGGVSFSFFDFDAY